MVRILTSELTEKEFSILSGNIKVLNWRKRLACALSYIKEASLKVGLFICRVLIERQKIWRKYFLEETCLIVAHFCHLIWPVVTY